MLSRLIRVIDGDCWTTSDLSAYLSACLLACWYSMIETEKKVKCTPADPTYYDAAHLPWYSELLITSTMQLYLMSRHLINTPFQNAAHLIIILCSQIIPKQIDSDRPSWL
jgi:hypothetical protein